MDEILWIAEAACGGLDPLTFWTSLGLLMEVGEEHITHRLRGRRYFYEALDSLQHTPESAIELLALSRGMLKMFVELGSRLLRGLTRHPLLARRLERSRSIRGVGEVRAVTWALEVGEVERFSSLGRGGLLRAVFEAGRIGGQGQARSVVQATQPAFVDDVDRGVEAGAAPQSGAQGGS